MVTPKRSQQQASISSSASSSKKAQGTTSTQQNPDGHQRGAARGSQNGAAHLRGAGSAVLVFLADNILPIGHRWMYLIPLLYLQRGFPVPVYTRALWVVGFMLLFPQTSLMMPYLYLMLYHDSWRREDNNATRVRNGGRFSLTAYCITSLWLNQFSNFIMRYDFKPLISILESLFGRAASWSGLVLTLQAIALIREERGPLNAFIPECTQGISLALLCYLACSIFPRWLQWGCYLLFSMPHLAYPGMLAQWMVSSISWMYEDVPPTAAYLVLLLTHQFPYADIRLQQKDRRPSSILRREREGSLWFGITLVLFRICEVCFTQEAARRVALATLLVFLTTTHIILGPHPYFKLLLASRLATDEFIHKPIRNADIRLLRILPQPRISGLQIRCDMIHERIADAPPYTAISYHWGTPSPEEMMEIIIDGASFKVSPSIHSLLLSKRSPWTSVLVWIDSICINQSDNAEKSQQVCSLMRYIYREASCVIGWLGESSDASIALYISKMVPYFQSMTEINQAKLSTGEWAVAMKEFERFLSNPWFERAWIIQEIAVSSNPILRYGEDVELTWDDLAGAVSRVFDNALGPKSLEFFSQGSFCDCPGALNMLLLDSIRRQVKFAEHLKLKDLAKLGLRFKATLPLDKIYALIGIAKERHLSFLRPNISRMGSLGVVVDDRQGQMIKDFSATLLTRPIKATPDMDWLKHLAEAAISSLLDDLRYMSNPEQIRRTLTQFKTFILSRRRKGNPSTDREEFHKEEENDLEDCTVPLEYSENATAKQIYIYVARDLLKEDDVYSMFRFAGIRRVRSQEMQSLPSWVPDWTCEAERYILPRSVPAERQDSNLPTHRSLQSCRDGGLEFLHVSGLLVGRVERLTCFTSDLDGDDTPLIQILNTTLQQKWNPTGSRVSPDSPPEIFDEANTDSLAQIYRYTKAQDSATTHERVIQRYETTERVKDAVKRTMMANIASNGKPASAGDVKDYMDDFIDKHNQLHFGLRCPDDEIQRQTELQGIEPSLMREFTCRKYLHRRRLQTSRNSMFAHLVRSDILPSYATYRHRVPGTGKSLVGLSHASQSQADQPTREKQKGPWQTPDMFANPEAGVLAGFTKYVDYTIGRKLAVTDSGFLGLVPDSAEIGDVLLWLEHENMFLLLRVSEQNTSGVNPQSSGECSEANTEGNVAAEQSDSARFIGESYVHDFVLGKRDGESFERKSFKLW
ncbi:hypothetical protein OIDMADRAFT_33660 [Oidiodendron maius Zn]|uniref:Heterokaryon incompatibility domain-containing protein n=1 Tax=Oidiodendron maius (strain Zn) TaxID=913774 RepID=A0A0C3GHF2_OIDMZ|nr:hypothetical protein OIDMADRAFT_33660 [Oidiodendron maius Zn]